MVTKDDGLQKLVNVKIILGNGFDLFCDLRTSYGDYFSKQKKKYELILNEVKEASNCLAGLFEDGLKPNIFQEITDGLTISSQNIWDIIFAISIKGESDKMWCDVEQTMFDFLYSVDTGWQEIKPHWTNVYNFLQKAPYQGCSAGSFILARCIKEKCSSSILSKDDFCIFLLDELKEFEGRFARFITRQHVAFDGFVPQFNINYVTRARQLLETLCKSEEITSIDCFNYGFTPEPVFYNKCNFVNGDCANPIFGVDSKFRPDDSKYVFTKTNRRIEWEMNRTTLSQHPDFENAIVFGHSLNENDYSYFFPVLDQLEMTNFASKKKFVITYCVYDPKKETEIKNELRHRIYALFVAYAKYKGQSIEPARLLDSLTTQGRVMTVSIPPCQKYQSFDADTVDLRAPYLGGKSVEEKWAAYIDWAKREFPVQRSDCLLK